jgi:elongation factor P hydroxylase
MLNFHDAVDNTGNAAIFDPATTKHTHAMNTQELTATFASALNASKGTLNYATAERAAEMVDLLQYYMTEGMQAKAQRTFEDSGFGPKLKKMIGERANVKFSQDY